MGLLIGICSLIYGPLFLVLIDFVILYLGKDEINPLEGLLYESYSLLIYPSSGLESDPD